jgi:cytochrome oxidase Cu insertion factor (SCO1/SenC/PrrC family)
MRHRHPVANASLAAVCAMLALALGASCGTSKNAPAAATETRAEGASASGFAGAALPLASARDFTLADEHGRAVSSSEYRGRVVVLAFLGASCGAPCVVIAQQIRGALDALGARVPVLLVSIDPAADTPRAIARLLARSSLAGRARYLVGPAASLRAVWRSYRVPAPARGSAVFGRFAPVVLLDRDGRARVAYALEGLTPESLAHDIRALSR